MPTTQPLFSWPILRILPRRSPWVRRFFDGAIGTAAAVATISADADEEARPETTGAR